MERLLTLDETIEDKIEQLRAVVKRPVYVVAPHGTHGGVDTKYRVPGALGYREMGSLEIYLSLLVGNDYCVDMEDMTPKEAETFSPRPVRGWRLFDLRATTTYRLVFPITSEDATTWKQYKVAYDRDFFQHVGLVAGNNDIDTVFPTRLDQDKIPDDLRPFINTYRRPAGGGVCPGIRFACSQFIVAPLRRRTEWHIGTATKSFASLQPPGRYNGQDFGSLTDFNRFGAIDVAPGPCIMCRGAKGERRHLVSLSSGGEHGAYVSNHICRACTGTAFTQIQAILDGAAPLSKPESES